MSTSSEPRARVVHLSSVHKPFDTRVFLKESSTLVAAGYDVTYVVPHEGHEEVAGVRIHAVKPPRNRRERMTSTARLVYRAALEIDADMYHLHDPELIPAGLRLKMRGKRVIADFHEDLPAQISTKDWIRPRLRPAVRKSAAVAERVAARAFDAIVAATPAIARKFDANKTVLVQNFPLVDELVAPVARAHAERDRTVAYVGGLTAIRGASEIVQAMGMLDGAEIRLSFAGSVTSATLEDELRAMPGWGRVVRLGWCSREQVRDLLGQARAGLVLFQDAPNHVEAQPNKLFEYMCAGIPVIASDFPLWREIVLGTGCGIVVDPRDPAAIAAGIRAIVDDPARAEDMGRLGREAVVRTYNWRPEGEKLVALYRELVGPFAP